MTLQPPIRSNTPNILGDRGSKPRNASHDPFAPTNVNQLYHQSFAPSTSLIAAHNILKRPGAEIRGSSVFPRKNFHHGNYFFAPDSSENNSKTHNLPLNSQQLHQNSHNYDRWNEIIQNQLENETKAVIEQKIQDRLRRQQYKANLDEMVTKKSLNNSNLGPTKDPNFEEEFQNAIAQMQMANKRQFRQVLAQGVQERQNLYNQQVQERIQDRFEVEQKIMDAQMFDQLQREQARTQKHKLMNELKENLDQHIQLKRQEEREKFEKDRAYTEHFSAELARRDDKNADFYKRIRDSAIIKNTLRGQRLEEFQKDSNLKNRTIDEIIEQNRQDKLKQEELEWQRREQYRKQMIRQNFKENQNIAQEKYHEFYTNKQVQEQISGQIKAQLEDAKMVDTMIKQNEKDYKRRYLDYLNQQVTEKRNNHVTGDEVSKAEKLMIMRGNHSHMNERYGDIENSTLPNGKNGYERRLQLSYIDKWLKHNPNLPPESHERIRRPRFGEGNPLEQN